MNFNNCSFFRTNILDRYFNRDFTLVLPDNKKITDIKWFAVYDLQSQVGTNFKSNVLISYLVLISVVETKIKLDTFINSVLETQIFKVSNKLLVLFLLINVDTVSF